MPIIIYGLIGIGSAITGWFLKDVTETDESESIGNLTEVIKNQNNSIKNELLIVAGIGLSIYFLRRKKII